MIATGIAMTASTKGSREGWRGSLARVVSNGGRDLVNVNVNAGRGRILVSPSFYPHWTLEPLYILHHSTTNYSLPPPPLFSPWKKKKNGACQVDIVSS